MFKAKIWRRKHLLRLNVINSLFYDLLLCRTEVISKRMLYPIKLVLSSAGPFYRCKRKINLNIWNRLIKVFCLPDIMFDSFTRCWLPYAARVSPGSVSPSWRSCRESPDGRSSQQSPETGIIWNTTTSRPSSKVKIINST